MKKQLLRLKRKRNRFYDSEGHFVDAIPIGGPIVLTVYGPERSEYIEIPTREIDWAGQRVCKEKVKKSKLEERIDCLILASSPEDANGFLDGKLQDLRTSHYGYFGKAVQYYKIIRGKD